MWGMSLRNGLLLVTGVVAVSFAAIFIRYAEAPSLTIAMYRQVMAAAVVLPLALALRRGELRRLSRRQLGLAAGSGALLALHFATWIPSVKLTTVAASVVLVTASPIFVAAGSRVLFDERVGTITVVGILVGLAGAAVVSGGDFAVSTRAVVGDLLALAGAVAAAGYFLVGRRLRQEVSALTYVGVVYATCAVLLWPVAALSGSQLVGFDAKTWAMFVLLALVPQLLGHSIFNFVLKYVSATVVTIAVMGEPIGSTLLALGFFGEVPPWTAVLGGALVLGGIYVAVTAQARVARRADAEPQALVTPLE
jgi:drug/metabolite transporter (DMT)-like permease